MAEEIITSTNAETATDHEYNASEIQVLKGLEAVRKRPGMYIGSTGERGLHHLVYEIVDNAIDEALAGYCDHIEVKILKGDIIQVTDNGRGIPVDIQADTGLPAVTVVYTILHAGGKFGGENSGYKVAGGLHGVGASVVNACSEWLTVNVRRDGHEYEQTFRRGDPDGPLKCIGTVDPSVTGTRVTFKPDPEMFKDTTVYNFETLEKRLREESFLNAGVKITLTDKDNQDAPDPAAFDVVFTNDGSELTATIKTGLKGVEYSFDGTTWSGVNTTTVAHLKDVTAYLRFKETDELNASEAVFKTVNSGHGKLVHHAAVQATCQNTGNIEYWECETCAKYYSDEAAAAEVSPADVIIAKTDHKWSVKYTYDKNGHWHKCEYCDAVTGAESHVSSGEATATEAEYCTVCGYIITPRKGGSSGGHVSGGGRDTTPTDTRPIINGERKTWTEIAADLGRQNGGSATISMSGETTVPAEVIKAIADRKIKVEFAYDSTKSWLIDGAKITTVSAADFSLFPGSVDTSSLRGVSGGKYRISADIPAEIRFTFLKRYAGEFANVYKLVDGKLVFQTCIKLAEDGTAVVPGMSAPGEYAVMVCRYSDRQGDFDNNGVLDIYDAVALLRYSVGLESGENLQLIDLNGDGMVNCADASMVLRWVVGLSA
mgnify:CR=1 FL=1